MSILLQLYRVKKMERHHWTPRLSRFHANGQMTGHLTKTALHLNLQISFIVVSRCRLAMSTSFFSYGLHRWRATMNLRPSPITRTCTIRLILPLLVVFHGRVPPSHMMARIMSNSHCGWRANIPSGSAIQSYSLKICSRIQILLDRLTTLRINSTITKENVAMSISCLVIGHGNRQ